MPRPRKPRRCREYDGDTVFKPRSIPMQKLETITLDLDELEALRLCDLDGHDQHSAGQRMGVSRGTVQRLVERGRFKLVSALVNSRALIIRKGEHHEGMHPDDR